MTYLASVHLVGGQLDPKSFSGAEREVIAKALTSGEPGEDLPVSAAFACDHCSEMSKADVAQVAAAMLGDVHVEAPATPEAKPPAKKKTKKKTKKKG